MTAALANQAQGPTFKHPYMSQKQAKWLFDLINTRIGDADPELFQTWRARYFSISNRAQFEAAIGELRPMPVLTAKVPETASAEGLYLDPATLKLYRLKAGQYGELFVSVYSQTAARRIDAATGQEVKKGTWKRLPALTSRIMLLSTDRVRRDGEPKNRTRILAEWLMTDQEKIEYLTGICNFCFRGLEDARSVRHNYGPVCAQRMNLPWGD